MSELLERIPKASWPCRSLIEGLELAREEEERHFVQKHRVMWNMECPGNCHMSRGEHKALQEGMLVHLVAVRK